MIYSRKVLLEATCKDEQSMGLKRTDEVSNKWRTNVLSSSSWMTSFRRYIQAKSRAWSDDGWDERSEKEAKRMNEA